MGLHTAYLGHMLVDPPLNAAEERYLRAFGNTRRWDRPEGPYVTLDHPAQEEPYEDIDRYSQPGPDEPALWCGWRPCVEGCCLSVCEETQDGAERYLTYLIEHFLAPGGNARRRTEFAEFTFDHVVNGVVFGEGAETREVFAIECVDNEVRRLSLMQGVSLTEAWGMGSAEELLARRARRLARRDRYIS